MPVLQLIKVSKIYCFNSHRVEALKNINLKINQGDFLAIMGPSGSGKSTLMHIAGCLDTPTSGKVILENKEVSRLTEIQLAKVRNQKIGFVFQAFNLLPRVDVLDNVNLPLVYAKVEKKEQEKRAIEILTRLGLKKRVHHFPNQLSGGEQQRVAIARALITQPTIILADEPTGNVDSQTSKEIMKILKKLNAEGNTIVVVTHDQEVAKFAKQIIKMKDGTIQAKV